MICLSGANYIEAIGVSKDLRQKRIHDIEEWIEEADCVSFYELAEYARKSGNADWTDLICRYAYYWTTYLKSRAWTLKTNID